MSPYPFIKWAGGKGRMISHIAPRIPDKFGRYFEPFLGGGAVFFELSREKRIKRAILGDMNPELMNAYRTVKDNVEDLISELCEGGYSYTKENYLSVRKWDTEVLSDVRRAARFVFLNRTCFNGLYRVNRKGGFNVPFGKYENPVVCDAVNLRSVSAALSKTRLVEKSFDYVAREARAGDVVYMDPPYYPLSGTSKFVSYTEGGFGLEEHTRLSIVFRQLADKGVTAILSNSFCPTTVSLYRDFEILELTGSRNVGGPADYRQPVREIMVVANGRPVRLDGPGCTLNP